MTDIALYSLDSDGVVTFSFANAERQVTGPEEALQVVAHHLFQTPGSNSYNREEGGGLMRLIRAPLGGDDEIRTEAAIIVSRAQASILRSQSSDKPANATVTSLQVRNVVVSRTELSIDLSVVINLLDGNSFQATFRTS